MRIAFDSCSDQLSVVHINDLASVESAAYLLKFDSVHGMHLLQLQNSVSDHIHYCH